MRAKTLEDKLLAFEAKGLEADLWDVHDMVYELKLG